MLPPFARIRWNNTTRREFIKNIVSKLTRIDSQNFDVLIVRLFDRRKSNWQNRAPFFGHNIRRWFEIFSVGTIKKQFFEGNRFFKENTTSRRRWFSYNEQCRRTRTRHDLLYTALVIGQTSRCGLLAVVDSCGWFCSSSHQRDHRSSRSFNAFDFAWNRWMEMAMISQ